MPDVSVILVNYKSPRLTVEAIRSVRVHNQQARLEFIVVDNDSGDDSETYIRGEVPEVIWHPMGYNSGFGRANNAGMALATGRYFLLLNADTLQTGDVLDECVRRLDAEPAIAAAAPIQLRPDGTPMPYFKSFADVRRMLFIVPLRPAFQRFLHWLIPEHRHADPRQHDWLVGAFLLVRREAVATAGGFDERFFMYAEDVEWGHRLGQVGKLCGFNDLGFIHFETPSEYRRDGASYVNRFNVQMQVSNLLWVRIQYGVGAVLSILLNYLLLIPVFFGWKIALNLLRGRSPLAQLDNQTTFFRKVRALLRYFWPILLARPGFFKIAPAHNIR